MKLTLIKKLCSLQKEQLQKIIVKYLKNKGYNNIINTNMYLVAEGDLPICLCAHMDTVFAAPPTEFYYDKGCTTLWSPQGLGADDRAGIYAIIKLIEKGYKPSIILTDLEERGGVGASSLIQRFPRCPFQECKALIQLDRQGNKDSVYYDCDNSQFEKKINSYGFTTDWGTFTDISIIAPAWGIAAVNLSVGYRREHSIAETLNMQVLENTIEKVSKMLDDCDNWIYYKYIKIKPFIFKCQCCGAELTDKEKLPCGAYGKLYVCEKCARDYGLYLY